jgi:hypothetical protein
MIWRDICFSLLLWSELAPIVHFVMIAIRSWNPFSESRTDADDRLLIRETWCTTKDSKKLKDHIDLIFEKKDLDFNTAAGLQAFGESVVSKRHRELAELNLRGSGSSSAWCSAHKGSAAAGRMFEDPEPLRIGSARCPWSLEQQLTRPV